MSLKFPIVPAVKGRRRIRAAPGILILAVVLSPAVAFARGMETLWTAGSPLWGKPRACLFAARGAVIGTTERDALYALEEGTGRPLGLFQGPEGAGCPVPVRSGDALHLAWPESGLIVQWTGTRFEKSWSGAPFQYVLQGDGKAFLTGDRSIRVLADRGGRLTEAADQPVMAEEFPGHSWPLRDKRRFIVRKNERKESGHFFSGRDSFYFPDWRGSVNPGEKTYLTAVAILDSFKNIKSTYTTLLECPDPFCGGGGRMVWRSNHQPEAAVFLAFMDDRAFVRGDERTLHIYDVRTGRLEASAKDEEPLFWNGGWVEWNGEGATFVDGLGIPRKPQAIRTNFTESIREDGATVRQLQIPLMEVAADDLEMQYARVEYFTAESDGRRETLVRRIETLEARSPAGARALETRELDAARVSRPAAAFALYEGKPLIALNDGSLALLNLPPGDEAGRWEPAAPEGPPLEAGGIRYRAAPEEYLVTAEETATGRRVWGTLATDAPLGTPAPAGEGIAVQWGGQLVRLDLGGRLTARTRTGCDESRCEGVPARSGKSLISLSKDMRLALFEETGLALLWEGPAAEAILKAIPTERGTAVSYRRPGGEESVCLLNAEAEGCVWDGPLRRAAEAPGWGIVGWSEKDKAVLMVGYDGAAIWKTPSDAPTSELVVDPENALLCFGSEPRHFQANDLSTGALLWRDKMGPATFSPAVRGGVIYVASDDRHVYAVEGATGEKIWTHQTGPPVEAAAPGERALAVRTDRFLYLLDLRTGKKIQAAERPASLWVARSGGRTAGADEGGLFRVNDAEDGFEFYDGAAGGAETPLPGSDGSLFLSGEPGVLRRFDPELGPLTAGDLRGLAKRPPLLFSNVYFFASENGRLIAMKSL